MSIDAVERLTPDASDEFAVRPGQVYVPCVRYNWEPMSILIIEGVVDGKADAVIPFGGGRHHPNGRHRWISLKSLHQTGTTAQGKERQTGFRLYTEPPADWRRLYLCGGCLRYFDRKELAVASYGPASSSCRPCAADNNETKD